MLNAQIRSRGDRGMGGSKNNIQNGGPPGARRYVNSAGVPPSALCNVAQVLPGRGESLKL